MRIEYRTEKQLPSSQLRDLFIELGWSDGTETEFMKEHFNAPFVNSTIVVSAWDGLRLVGCVRVLSDRIVRSVIHDLAVAKEYRKQGIGTELVKRCIACFPDSEWQVGTAYANIPFYEKLGFKVSDTSFLCRASKWF